MRRAITRRQVLSRFALAGIGLTAASAILPVAAEAGGLFDFGGIPSADDQKKVGDQAAAQLLKQNHEVTDGRATHFREIGRRLVHALPQQDQNAWNFRFHVLESKQVNAFALPGGSMFLYTGLYENLATDDALAGVTGHEMTHVRKQHWALAQAQEQKRDLLLALGLSIFHAGQAAQSIAGFANGAFGLRYSRGEEQQADIGGFNDMVAVGFNPNGMIQLFETLERLAGNGGTLGGDFLSNHPLTSDRIATVRQEIGNLQQHQGQQFPPLTPLDYKALKSR